MSSNFPSEDARYTLYRAGAHLAWWTAVVWTFVLTWVNIRRGTALPDTFQEVSGIFIVLLMGMGVALGSALARMRLARTIQQVFRVGADVAAAGSRERQMEIIRLLKQDLEQREHGDRQTEIINLLKRDLELRGRDGRAADAHEDVQDVHRSESGEQPPLLPGRQGTHPEDTGGTSWTTAPGARH